jgi:hypothetical protein
MDGIGRTCLECQAPLAPGARFCPRCGQPTSLALPAGPSPGPGDPGPGFGQGPGSTFAAQTAPPAPGAGWAEQTRADWADPTVTQPPVQAPRPPLDPPYVAPAPAGEFYYGQARPDPPRYSPFRPYEPQGPPGGPPSDPFQGPPRQPPRRHDRNSSGTPVALWVILLVILVGGGAAAGLLLAHPFSHPGSKNTASGGGTAAASAGTGTAPASAAASAATTPAAATSTPAVTEQQAATNVATMLNQSVSDRSAINTAYNDVLACNSQLASAPQVFDNAATSRQKLLASLGAMPGRAALPPALLSDLTQAWQASIAADQAFARWATDELQDCTPHDTGSAAYRATATPDANATKYKTLFVAQWNPIAARYNLTQYQQNQL